MNTDNTRSRKVSADELKKIQQGNVNNSRKSTDSFAGSDDSARRNSSDIKRKRAKAKKRQSKKFKNFLKIYAIVLGIAALLCWLILYSFIKDYEQGQPTSEMDIIAENFTSEKIDKFIKDSGIKVSKFESNESVSAYLKDKVSNTKISYKKKVGEYSDSNPVFLVYADDNAIAKVFLKENGKNFHKFTKWKLSNIEFGSMDKKSKNSDITISVPKGSSLTVNGVEVDASYISEDDVKITYCQHVGDFVTEPLTTKYTIPGLISKPEIKASMNGADLLVSNEGNKYSANYPDDPTLFNEQKDRALMIAETYGRYIINRGSLEKLSSYMVGYAKEYVNDIPAVWAFLYGKTFTYEFQNEEVTNMQKYSDACFSCDIKFDLYVDWKTGNKTYNTNLTYTFVKINGNWVVADMIIS